MAHINIKYDRGDTVYMPEIQPEMAIYTGTVVTIRIDNEGIRYLIGTFGWYLEDDLCGNLGQAKQKLKELWAEQNTAIDTMDAKKSKPKPAHKMKP